LILVSVNLYSFNSRSFDDLTGSLVNESLQSKFQNFVDAEEARLAANLDAVDYDIDAADTLVLVTGQGRIEKVGPNPFVKSCCD
jgi:hypothetical protein